MKRGGRPASIERDAGSSLLVLAGSAGVRSSALAFLGLVDIEHVAVTRAASTVSAYTAKDADGVVSLSESLVEVHHAYDSVGECECQ